MAEDGHVETDEGDRAALEKFAVDNTDLDRLENLMERFNVFEALGVVRQEVRHSDFLAFLLDPRESHGLGDLFARRFLQAVLVTGGPDNPAGALALSPLELELIDLSRAEVVRERDRIDVLLLDEENRLAVAVENKVFSGEHSGQLGRYRLTLEEGYPGWRKVFLFLTPLGEPPSDEFYVPVGYGAVCELVERLVASRGERMDENLRGALGQYAQMLRRHVVGDSDVAELCRRIYRKHKKALDLIYEHRPDRQDEIRAILERLVTQREGLALDHSSKSKIKFAVSGWDTASMVSGDGWTSSGRVMLFEFWNYPRGLELKLLVGPGPGEVRHRLIEMARSGRGGLKGPRRAAPAYATIYSKRWSKGNALEQDDPEDAEKKLRRRFEEFVEKDLPRIEAVLKEQRWFWTERPPDAGNSEGYGGGR